MCPESNGRAVRCLGIFAATIFIGCSAAINSLHGYSLGARTSEVTGAIFALASLGGAALAPASVAATFLAFKRWQFVRGLIAMTLAAVCFAYACISSLGFVSGARDVAAATRGAEADAYAIARDKAKAANAELKTLADAPRGTRKVEAERAERRAQLEKDRADAERVMAAGTTATVADPTAASLAAYYFAVTGREIEPAKLSPWLVLSSVLFFELGAAASLIVVGALPKPAREEKPKALTVATEEKAPEPVAEAPVAPQSDDKKTAGRKRSRALDDVLAKIDQHGGTLEGTLDELGERLGLSKSSAHRALHALAGAGMIGLTTSAAGTLVQLRPVI